MKTTAPKPAKRVGRPTTPGVAGKKSTLSIRASADLKNRLDDAAKFNGRSFSQEAEFRLEISFRDEDQALAAFARTCGPFLAGVLMAVEKTMRDAGSHAGFSSTGFYEGSLNWFDNPVALREAVAGANELLGALRAKEGVSANELDPAYHDLGVGIARGVLEAIRNPDRRGGIGDWAAPVRQLLGEAAKRLEFEDSEVIVNAIEPGPHQIASIARMTMNKEKKS